MIVRQYCVLQRCGMNDFRLIEDYGSPKLRHKNIESLLNSVSV